MTDELAIYRELVEDAQRRGIEDFDQIVEEIVNSGAEIFSFRDLLQGELQRALIRERVRAIMNGTKSGN